MVSPASFQVGCRSYSVPFVVDFAHRNDVNGDVLLDGPVSTVPLMTRTVVSFEWRVVH